MAGKEPEAVSHWQSNTKIDVVDREFSKYIIKRDGNRCQVCGADGRMARLENSHFWGRRMESVRFDPRNCDALCSRCHAKFETEKGDVAVEHDGVIIYTPRAYKAWKIKQMGQEAFDVLELKAHTYQKKDRKLSRLIVRALTMELDRISGPQIIGRKA